MLRNSLIGLLLLVVLGGCGTTEPVAATAAALRLENSQRFEQVVAIVRRLELSDVGRRLCQQAQDRIREFTALAEDLDGRDVAGLLSAVRELDRLAFTYDQVRGAYRRCQAVVRAQADTLALGDQLILERWHRDAMTLDGAMQQALTADPTAMDRQRVIRDLLTLLPVVIRVGAALAS